MQLSTKLLPDVVQVLDHHEEALRIKKLIFCLCKKYWENEPHVLNTFSCKDLLEELIIVRPTVEQLTFSLYKLVKTLNRPKVYAGVAKVILDQVTPLYETLNTPTPVLEAEPIEEEEGTQIRLNEANVTPTVDPRFLVAQVTQQIETHQEQSRIKKLIYCICRNRWENDLAVIDGYGLTDLIRDICQMYPTRHELQIGLKQIVDNLNKQTLYLAIANIILNQLDVLYSSLAEESALEKEGSTQIYNTQIIQLNSFNTPQPMVNSQRQAFETSVIDLSFEQGGSVTELKQIEPVPEIPVTPAYPPYDVFEIRQTIFQYTNPLRAKILLFSVLFHPWDKSGQDWSMLRSYTIDDLVEQIMQGGYSLAEIEQKLQTTAKGLSEVELHSQAASTILEAIKPFI